MTKVGNLSIHTENILPIIKKWLYAEKEIFLRELVSNSCDALHKLKLLQKEGVFSSTHEFTIHIEIDKKQKTLTIEDTGLGMTEEEVEKYIAQIAFSSFQEFFEVYKTQGKEDIIGHFGLGFFSAFMVAKKVEIETLSFKKNEKAVHFSSDGSIEYSLRDWFINWPKDPACTDRVR